MSSNQLCTMYSIYIQRIFRNVSDHSLKATNYYSATNDQRLLDGFAKKRAWQANKFNPRPSNEKNMVEVKFTTRAPVGSSLGIQ